MANRLSKFESIARRAHQFSETEETSIGLKHPFEIRNIDFDLPAVVRRLFDNAHYSQATFEAFKYFEKLIQKHSKVQESGVKLMMQALEESGTRIKLSPLSTTSEKDEQKGYQFLFAGGILAFRNPRGHEYTIIDDPETCLDHLGFVSMLLRKLKEVGYK